MPSGGGGSGNGGINICCCRICTCINLQFLVTKNGLLKLCEVILGSFCQTLLIRFGMPYASDIGQAFTGFLTTVASCLTTATVLLICYLLSAKTYHLLRQSLFVSNTYLNTRNEKNLIFLYYSKMNVSLYIYLGSCNFEFIFNFINLIFKCLIYFSLSVYVKKIIRAHT